MTGGRASDTVQLKLSMLRVALFAAVAVEACVAFVPGPPPFASPPRLRSPLLSTAPSFPRQWPHQAGRCVAVSVCSLSPCPVLWPAPPSLCVSLQVPYTGRRYCSSSGPMRYARAAQACRRRAAPLPPCLSLPLAPRCKCRARARLW